MATKTAAISAPARFCKPVPVRALILGISRIRHTSTEIGNAVLGFATLDATQLGLLVERLEWQVNTLDRTIHALEVRHG